MTAPANHPTHRSLADEFEAAIAWWREAGVDQDFSDDVTDWLADDASDLPQDQSAPPLAVKKRAVPPPPPPAKMGGKKDSWPVELGAFQQWWVSSPEIDQGGAYPIIGPAGGMRAKLMVIVDEPEEHDGASLLEGPHGTLLRGMMHAAQISPNELYLASVLRRHTPMPDWAAVAAAGAGELLLHHIGLAVPERILSLGRNIPPLLGNDTTQGAAILQNVNHEGGSIPMMGAGSLAELLRSAGKRQRFWQRWLEWTE